jgi:hypothetical protein
MATTIRARSVLAVALLLALAVFPPLARPALAQDGLSQAQALMDDARARSGEIDALVADQAFALEQEATAVSYESLATDIADFYATYTIVVPRDGVDEPYDHGIAFRDDGASGYQFIILSSAEDSTLPVWGVLTADELIAEGEFPRRVYNTDPGELNVVELAVVGESAAFAVNGEVIDLIELYGAPDVGDVAVSTGITNSGTVPGDLVEFEGVSLWSFDDGAPPADGPAADGALFQGDNFDWAITYDDAWELVDADTSGGEDWAWFSNGISDVDIFAFEESESPAECIQREIAYLDSESDYYSDLSIATNLAGDELIGASPDGAYEFAVAWATWTDDSGDTAPVTVFLRCQSIVPGESILFVRQTVGSDVYNDELPARIALLAGLTVGAPTDGAAPDDETATTGADTDDERPSTRDETPTPVADDAVVVTLDPLEGNADGEATLTPSGTRTVVDVVADAPAGTLVSIQEGSCDDLAGEEAYAAGELDENGESSARVRVDLDDLLGMYVVTLVDADTLDFANPLACGEI